MSVHDFLDLEALVSLEEEEEEEGEEDLSDFFDDDEMSSDGLGYNVSHVGFASSAVQDLEDEARGHVARRTGPDTRSLITSENDNLALPFRVPRDTDPSVWSVRVKLGQEANIVLQICRRCLEPSESRPPAITSAFARSSIPGYVFIEGYNVGEARRAVNGFVTVRDKQPQFIPPTEYVGLLSRDTFSSSRVEVGQWVRSLVGRYRNDLGYVFETDEWDAFVVFVPRIPEPRGKRQRDGRPPPRAWTASEVVQQYGQKRVQVRGPNKFVFGGAVYEDGLVMVWVPISHLRVSNYSPGDIAPFVRSPILRTDPLFDACVKRFAQDSTQVGDRTLVVSGEHAGIIGRIERIQNNVADVLTQSPEEHLGLVITTVLRDLMPHFLAGDHVKDRWSDRFGIVVAVDNDDKTLTFLSKETNEEIVTSTLGVQFYSSPLRFFRFTQGLFVEFPGTAGLTRRGCILQASDGSIKVMDERDGKAVDVNEDEITVSGVQAPSLSKSRHRSVWEDQRVVVAKGPFKGYRGLVKVQYEDGVDVDLDAKLATSGRTRQRFRVEDVFVERLVEYTAMPAMPVAPPSRLNRTPSPEVMTRPLTPEPEEPEESTPWSTARRPTWKHWLFAEELQKALGNGWILFRIRGVPALSPHVKYEGFTAKTVVVAKQTISPEPNEVVVSVFPRGRAKQISIDPYFLVPWPLAEGNEVIVVGYRWIGQVGKLVKLVDGCCAVDLASSGEISYFLEADILHYMCTLQCLPLPPMENSTQLYNVSLKEQEILATHWLTVGQLEEAGIPCRRGPFVERETQIICEAIEKYQSEHKLNDEQLDDLVYADVASAGGFWSYVARAVPQRGVKSVFYHVRRIRDSSGRAGKWSPLEDEELLRLVQTHGRDWPAVAEVVGRSPAHCSDRYHQHVLYKDTKRIGAWSPEEESQLICAIKELAEVGKTDISTRGFWVSVSKAFGGTRTPKQCRSKWSATLQPKIGNEGKGRWNKTDSYILICKIASLNVDEETDIDWKSFNDPSWTWSSHSLKQRWRRLKALIDTDGMSHRDIINALVERTRLILTANHFAPSSSMSSMSSTTAAGNGS